MDRYHLLDYYVPSYLFWLCFVLVDMYSAVRISCRIICSLHPF